MKTSALVRWAVAMAFAACVAAPAHAAEPRVDGLRALMEHMARGIPTTKVGDWITYRLYGGSEARQAFWRVGVAGEEKDSLGRDALWVEVEMGEHHKMRAPLAQARLLVAKDPQEGEQAVTRIFFGWGAERVQELTPDAVKLAFTPPPAPADDSRPKDRTDPGKMRVVNGKEQRLMTLAGTVSAVPVEIRYGAVVLKRIWLSRELPILQLARMDLVPVDHSLEVREYGTGYKSQMILPAPGQPKVGIEKLSTPSLPDHGHGHGEDHVEYEDDELEGTP